METYKSMTQATMNYDLVIVGAGPAGLSAAIRYAQLCKNTNKQLSVCILEKGAEVGAHILSGAVFDTRALDELLPDWQSLDAPLHTPASEDRFQLLTSRHAFTLPTPPQMKNHGHYVISLGLLCRWLGKQAEELGVEIYPGFPGTSVVFNDKNEVIGVKTGEMGIDKTGAHKPNYQPGMTLLCKQLLLAEGCRGSLTQQLIHHYDLNKNKSPQTYGIGIKEIWEIPQAKHVPGKVVHTVGWPLDPQTYGGSFIYHWGNNLVSIGLVVGLDYQNPYLDPYEEFQRLKQHPHIRPLLEGGQCIGYGARALNEGGWQSLPTLNFPGGMLLGDAAGFLNVPQIKGSHNAMKSGMLAADALFEGAPQSYPDKINQSWVAKELIQARNIRPAFHYGLWAGLAYAAVDTYLLRGKAPWTLSNHADNLSLKPAKCFKPIVYPKHDGIISFDKLTSVARTNVFHEENQPCHLRLNNPNLALSVNLALYDGPETRYCPASVYEYIDDKQGHKQLHINAQNCIHCKTCDIKDPTQNIVWAPPEGGGGPNYSEM
jgi:electron-transferring-flavoprotein dehydrogenase